MPFTCCWWVWCWCPTSCRCLNWINMYVYIHSTYVKCASAFWGEESWKRTHIGSAQVLNGETTSTDIISRSYTFYKSYLAVSQGLTHECSDARMLRSYRVTLCSRMCDISLGLLCGFLYHCQQVAAVHFFFFFGISLQPHIEGWLGL